MFEFSFVSVLAAILVGAVLWHFMGRKIFGWVSAEEAALKAQLVLWEHRLGITEQALAPPAPAPTVAPKA
jgi:hypothetical protein